MQELLDQVEREGWGMAPVVLDASRCDELVRSLSALGVATGPRQGGVRDLFARAPIIQELAATANIRSLVEQVLSSEAFAVRAVFFDKSPESNWSLPWHQDLTIAVAERTRDVDGFGPWSVKDGIHHVQPPDRVLERMVTLRLHLDECGADNGALWVLPGSHLAGSASPRPVTEASVCPVPRGGLLLMRPLLWHSSRRAERPSHRRVVHLEFADTELPKPLRWHEKQSPPGLDRPS